MVGEIELTCRIPTAIRTGHEIFVSERNSNGVITE